MNPLLCRLCLSRWGNPSINPWTHIHTSRFMPSPKRLVSFTHALFEGLKWDLTFSSAQNLKDLSPSVWNMQNIACLWHFFQIACSLPWLMLWKLQTAKYNYECLYVHVYRCVCSGVFLYIYYICTNFRYHSCQPFQLPWRRFSRHLAQRKGLRRPGS